MLRLHRIKKLTEKLDAWLDRQLHELSIAKKHLENARDELQQEQNKYGLN